MDRQESAVLYCQPQEVENNIMENMAMLVKLPALVIKRKGDLEQLLKDSEKYIDNFQIFLEAMTASGAHDKQVQSCHMWLAEDPKT